MWVKRRYYDTKQPPASFTPQTDILYPILYMRMKWVFGVRVDLV